MNIKITCFIIMISFHILHYYIYDYFTHKIWRKLNYHQQITSLIRCFGWAFMVTIPLLIYSIITGYKLYVLFLIINCLMRFMIDDLKADGAEIDLIEEQLFHITNIIVTWLLWLYIL